MTAPLFSCYFDTKAFDDIYTTRTVKGLEKSMVHIPYRKAPLTPSILLQFNAHLDLRDSAHLASWSACLIGFFTFFRTANLVPPSLDTFSSRNTLFRSSITFNSSGVLITITRTKTCKAGDISLVVPVLHVLGFPLLPHLHSTPHYGPFLHLALILSSPFFPPCTSLLLHHFQEP